MPPSLVQARSGPGPPRMCGGDPCAGASGTRSLRLGALVAWLPHPRVGGRGGPGRRRGAAPPAAGAERWERLREGTLPAKGERSRWGPAPAPGRARRAWGPSPGLCRRRPLPGDSEERAAAHDGRGPGGDLRGRPALGGARAGRGRRAARVPARRDRPPRRRRRNPRGLGFPGGARRTGRWQEAPSAAFKAPAPPAPRPHPAARPRPLMHMQVRG